MLEPISTQGLTGLEQVIAVGWPYHGVTRARYINGYLHERELVGHAWAAGAAITAEVDHYLIKMQNPLSPEWSYHYLYSYSVISAAYGVGCLPAAYSATYRNPLPIGVPLHVAGAPIRAGVFFNATSKKLTLRDMSSGAIKEFVISMPSPADVKFAIADYSGRAAMVTLDQLVGLNTQSVPTARARVLDFFNNKMLVAIEATGVCLSLSSIPLNAGNNYYGSWNETSQNHTYEQGLVFVSIVEIVLPTTAVADAGLTVVASAQGCAGTVDRVSPESISIDGRSHTHEWSLSVSNAVLDAFYLESGAVKKLHGSFNHSRTAQKVRSANDAYDNEFSVTHDSSFTVEGSSQSIKHEFKHSTSDWKATCKIYRNGTIISDQEAFDYNQRTWPIKSDSERAPWAGVESRYITAGFAVAYGEQPDFAPEIYTITCRNNTTRTHAAYSTTEPLQRFEDAPVLKSVSAAHIVGRATSTVPAFVDSVDYNDSRYVRQGGTNVFHMRGYIGARLRGVTSPKTLAYGIESIDYPVSFVNFR